MPTELNLINFEQFGNFLFLISTFYAFASGNQATKSVLEKQQSIPNSGIPSSSEKSAQLAFLSTSFSAAAYVLFTLIAITRRNQLEKETIAGTTTTSIAPISTIAIGFAIALFASIIRLPALQQRIREAQMVIL